MWAGVTSRADRARSADRPWIALAVTPRAYVSRNFPRRTTVMSTAEVSKYITSLSLKKMRNEKMYVSVARVFGFITAAFA